MTHIIHTQADLETAVGVAHQAGPAVAAGFRQDRDAGDSPPRGGLCRAVLHRLRPAAFDRQRGGDPGAAVRGVRSVPPRYRAAGARRQARAARPVAGPRSSRSRKSARPSPEGHIDLNAVAAMEADQAHAALTALHGIGPWTADIYLLFCLGNADAWPAGDLALAGGGAHRLRPEEAAGCQGAWRSLPKHGGRGAGWPRICCGPTIMW